MTRQVSERRAAPPRSPHAPSAGLARPRFLDPVPGARERLKGTKTSDPSRCRPRVLVDEASEQVTSTDPVYSRLRRRSRRNRRRQSQPTVRPSAVVVLDVDAENPLEVSAAEEQD